ncbi:cystathionine beta-lyase/cystathionine gamma-synthase [Bernardetia litoralis DSM 6794]|uniref:Cystathionine beta-lyase/cystathionine gamma-synthase n=2 Tax=Bernardetia litoralis TaxID=999 RepID=I4ALF5_BERLS|nr:cystathionine beta-lyase/cystathionine gamma-synthase [Bernardetia litoralis DSM 6794]
MIITEDKTLNYIKEVLENMPSDWLKLTTHRLDIYNEEQAKTEFLEQFEILFETNNAEKSALSELPTAYDYIRLGHPLSSVLEWAIAKLHHLKSENIISFSSATTPILAVLRKNLLTNKATQIVYSDELPAFFDTETIRKVYGYEFELKKVEKIAEIEKFDGSIIYLSQKNEISKANLDSKIDFFLNIHSELGSILFVNGKENESYISEIQHVRRRETIAMTPDDCFSALQILTENPTFKIPKREVEKNKNSVLASIKKITYSDSKAVVGSSGLSVQYAIMMGVIQDALENHKGKAIKFLVPPNCYGGTNDQARRVAACLDNVEVMDLPVDGDNDMVKSINTVLEKVAQLDAVPYIIAEIPTNPRVEVPDMIELEKALTKEYKTPNGEIAIQPVFILDQTFCPNVNFLGENQILSTVKTIAYVSGSKFPSGGKVTAGFAVANKKAAYLMDKIAKNSILCDNDATDLQMEFLAEQLPSMNQRIEDAYKNTRKFVTFIEEVLPAAKINFVSEELAKEGFTPSVFSLDLPTKGNTAEEKETHKRELNNKLITMMITQIPTESKYCVSYGQLKGCYWTIPATSTQGTTKESDKDYIARVSLSANMDLEKHKEVFTEFVKQI